MPDETKEKRAGQLVELHSTFTLNVTTSQLRLICAALYGGLKDDQKADALALQMEIAKQRASQAKHVADEAQKYFDNILKAQGKY